MTEPLPRTDEIVPISIDFFQLNESLQNELEAAFPEADIVTTNAFSGQELCSLLIDTSGNAVKQLADLFQRWKNSGQEVSGKIGETSFSVKGFNADDTTRMMTEIRKVIQEAHK